MKITLRLWLMIMAIVVLTLSMIWLFLVFLLPDMYQRQISREMDGNTDLLLQLWENRDSDAGSKALNQFIFDNKLHMDIRTADGTVIDSRGWDLDADVLTHAELIRVFEGQYIATRYVRPGFGDTLKVAKQIYVPDQDSLLLLVCTPIAPVEDLQNLLRQQMIAITGFALLLAIGTAFLMSRMFVSPIYSIERMAQQISTGDYSQRIQSRDGTELGDLARTIDHMADQLSRMESLRQSFIATVSHQFKTPLSIIQGHTELVQDSLPAGLEQGLRGSFAVIQDEINRLDRMSRDILKLSELQSGIKLPTLIELPLLPFVQDLCTSLEILDPSIRFTLDIAPEICVLADPQEIEHVFRNILQNAIRHARADSIRITAASAESARISIRDNGIGLQPEQQLHLWDRFYKGNQKDRSGSGLGMAIVAAVLQAHKSEYGVISEQGQGTEIWFTLQPGQRTR